MKRTSLALLPVALAASALLASCGGGDDDGPTNVPNTDVPATATQSAAGAVSFVKSEAAANKDTAEPLAVGDAVLGTSETAEPDPV